RSLVADADAPHREAMLGRQLLEPGDQLFSRERTQIPLDVSPRIVQCPQPDDAAGIVCERDAGDLAHLEKVRYAADEHDAAVAPACRRALLAVAGAFARHPAEVTAEE